MELRGICRMNKPLCGLFSSHYFNLFYTFSQAIIGGAAVKKTILLSYLALFIVLGFPLLLQGRSLSLP